MGGKRKSQKVDFIKMKKEFLVLDCLSGSHSYTLEENSELELVIIQEESCESSIEVTLKKCSRLKIFTFCLGGKIKNSLKINLSGEAATASLFGLTIGGGNEIMENHIFMRHELGHTESNQTYKSILSDRAMGVFNGKIRVEKGADKSNAYQLNKNILLSDDATMQSKPQLEIFADDVKCTHGATTGQIDREAIFYLKSRGIGENEARKILIEAFVEDLVSGINDVGLRESIMTKIAKKLKI